MKLNTAVDRPPVLTHGGSPAAAHLTPLQQLRRSVLSCLLWEKEFYQDGQSIAAQIEAAAAEVTPQDLASLAVEARSAFHLRHAPLLLLACLAKRGGSAVAPAIRDTIQRADELAEFVAVYWRNGKTPLSKQVKKGLALAFPKFSAYALAKYNRDGAVKLRDVMFLVHPKPQSDEQAATWKQLAAGTLPVPDTWEVALSAGKDKRETWTRLLTEGQLGYLALLRNLRNMTTAGVDVALIDAAIRARKGAERVLPFRYVAAARACPQMEPALDAALLASLTELRPFAGMTVVLVDVSGSMDQPLSQRSDMLRVDTAAALAAMVPGTTRLFSFSDALVEVPPRKGMAGVDAIVRSQRHSGTALFRAVAAINAKVPYDRIIVITDEQDTAGGTMPAPNGRGYLLNVASYKNGVGYGKWTHIDGFSENVLRWMQEVESAQ